MAWLGKGTRVRPSTHPAQPLEVITRDQAPRVTVTMTGRWPPRVARPGLLGSGAAQASIPWGGTSADIPDTELGHVDVTRRRLPPAAPLEAEIAIKRGGLEGTPPTAFVFGKVPQVPAWRTSRRPAAASEGSSARFGTPAASQIAPQGPFVPRARP